MSARRSILSVSAHGGGNALRPGLPLKITESERAETRFDLLLGKYGQGVYIRARGHEVLLIR